MILGKRDKTLVSNLLKEVDELKEKCSGLERDLRKQRRVANTASNRADALQDQLNELLDNDFVSALDKFRFANKLTLKGLSSKLDIPYSTLMRYRKDPKAIPPIKLVELKSKLKSFEQEIIKG